MSAELPRRSFLKSAAAAGACAGLGDFGFLNALPPVSAAEARLEPGFARFRPEIEPLVRLLEETPRERLLEEVGLRIRRGTSYPEVLAALMLAGVRNIQPRPVGFKFHAVLVVNSAHLASRNSPPADRWLPIFWALDQFKSSQARDVQEGDWTLPAVDERKLPAPAQARDRLVRALESWDEPDTDVAIAAWVRSAPPQEIFDVLCHFGARDFRDIGHKAIYVANSWRTLQTIGWHHAEPVLRSLAYALLYHEGGNPAQRDAAADRAGRSNLERRGQIRTDWASGAPDPQATTALLETLREGESDDASRKVVDLLNRGVAPHSLWDAVFLAAGELLMRRPGIVSLHAVTTTNALHYAYQQVRDDPTRRFLLLQNAAFLPLFRTTAGLGRDVAADARIDTFAPTPATAGHHGAVEEIFADVSRDRLLAARKTLSWLGTTDAARPFIDAAQRLIYLKGTNSHDYKFSSAVLEDYAHLSPSIRDRFLAASVFWLRGAGSPDSPLVARTRMAL